MICLFHKNILWKRKDWYVRLTCTIGSITQNLLIFSQKSKKSWIAGNFQQRECIKIIKDGKKPASGE